MKTRTCILHAALACALLSPVATAVAHDDAQDQPAPQATPAMDAEQQAMMAAWQKAATPGPQHAQLAEHFAGTWSTKQTMWMDPSAPPMTETGKSVDTAVLGGRQIRTEFSSQFMGQPFNGIGFTGYDNVRGKFTSSWADDMSTGLMTSTGDYDPATKTYTFTTSMADPMNNGAMVPVRETIRIIDADHHVMEMFESRDGKETRTMQIDYARVK
jgi:hypothetical protein